jgi:DNA-binding NarL/FixJ family response regulator
LLEDQPDFVVLGEAEDGHAAVALAQELLPDVVLMDLAMPGMDVIEATQRITATLPGVRVIGLSMYDDPEKERLMRQAGAEAYVTKGGPPEALFAAIRAGSRE